MNPSSLKDELEAEIKQSESGRRKKVVLVLCCLPLLLCLGLALLASLPPSGQRAAADSPGVIEPSREVEASTKTSATASPEASQTASTPLAKAEGNSLSSPELSATGAIDTAAFKALGHRIGGYYGNIVELVTFPAGMNDNEKVSRIKQSYALDKQYFREVIGLRAMVNSANNVPPEYMSVVELAESGVSAISVGVDGLNRWADNPNGTASLEGNLGMVERGARGLRVLAEKLDQL